MIFSLKSKNKTFKGILIPQEKTEFSSDDLNAGLKKRGVTLLSDKELHEALVERTKSKHEPVEYLNKDANEEALNPKTEKKVAEKTEKKA